MIKKDDNDVSPRDVFGHQHEVPHQSFTRGTDHDPSENASSHRLLMRITIRIILTHFPFLLPTAPNAEHVEKRKGCAFSSLTPRLHTVCFWTNESDNSL